MSWAKGMADVFGASIDGPEKWRHRGEKNNMYQTEHDEMYAALREGKPKNNAEEGASSTLLGLMGRMACYTGAVVTWDQAMNSKESLVPNEFVWGDAPERPVPVPGVTRFA